ncbi:MAG: bifunctional DNA primase/polymerase [Propionibacteriaceae bacterium]|jgi:hypothetical protein|nr:bifunctional DNA primase/polymerase [Propionibacteriaceae bacterium]
MIGDGWDVFSRIQHHDLPTAAATLASSGVPVFPCVPGKKRPWSPHGFLDATTDTGQVAAWWREVPRANIGIPTGHLSGIDVVDIDMRPDGNGYPTFRQAANRGLAVGWVVAVTTPSGGLHLYYPSDPANQQTCWATSAKVDFRGSGGYIVAPPSVVRLDDGHHGQYKVTHLGSSPAPIDVARLRAFVDPVWAKRRELAARHPVMYSADGLADRMARVVTGLQPGNRNSGLFWAACQMARAGHDITETLTVLGPNAEGLGLETREITATIRSAYRTRTNPKPTASTAQQRVPAPVGEPRPFRGEAVMSL